MLIDVSNLMSISDANRNFSLVARRCEASGPVVILKNNKPRFLLVPFSESGVQEGMDLFDQVRKGTAMRKLTYKTITTDRPVELLELTVTREGSGIRLNADALTDQRAARQTTLFQGYAALQAAAMLGLDAARQMLNDQGAPVSLQALAIPEKEDGRALLATWFYRALTETNPERRVMHLYNAFGALPGGYAQVHKHAEKAGKGQGALLVQAAKWVRRDEDDSGNRPDWPEEPDLAQLDAEALLQTLVDIGKNAI